ncbi:hypothetical protein HHI36_022553, partial [Cryptolaemus montrouzieri]
KLNHENTRREYETELRDRTRGTIDGRESLEEAMKRTADLVLRHKQKRRKEWLQDETWNLIE